MENEIMTAQEFLSVRGWEMACAVFCAVLSGRQAGEGRRQSSAILGNMV
jgi:hypothetical protein